VSWVSGLWVRWGALTRSLISTRIAVERERSFWESLNFTNRSNLKIKAKARGGAFTIRLVDHVNALDDEGTVLAAALVLSYSLAESAVTDHLGLDSRRVAGIEDWGGRLLKAAGRDWSQVEGGLAGAVEVGVVRNLIVHGVDSVDAKSHQRLVAVGCGRFATGSPLALDYETVGVYRARLRSLLMAGGLGSNPAVEHPRAERLRSEGPSRGLHRPGHPRIVLASTKGRLLDPTTRWLGWAGGAR